MTRSELISKILSENPEFTQAEVETIVETFFTQIIAALEAGNRVELRGFGTFSVKQREARVGRNPRSGATVKVAPKRVPFFKTGRGLHGRLNGKS